MVDCLVASGVFLTVLLLGAQMLSIDSDLGRHITLGNYILDNRAVPTHDLLSHTLTGQSRPPYEWLSQVAFALSNRFMGLDGVILLTAMLISASILVVFRHSVQRSGSTLAALLVTLLVTAATSLHWLPRPHVVTFLLLAIWIHNLEKLRAGDRVGIYLFPIIMLFWTNLHGGFIFGFLALGAYFAGWVWDRWRNQTTPETGKKLLQAGIFSLVASVITPDLWRNWEAVLNNRSAFILSRTAETMPPNFTDTSSMPFVILLLLCVVFGFLNRRDASPAHFFLLGGLGVMAVLMARNIPLFSIACAPFLASWIATTANHFPRWKQIEARFRGDTRARKPYIPPLTVTVIAVLFFVYQYSKGAQAYQFDPRVFPVQAVDWLGKNRIEGRMFNEFNWGGYLLYRTWPHDLVFVDSQSDFYGEGLMRDYLAILSADENSQALLTHYQVDWVIVPFNSPLARELRQDSKWEISYEDSVAIIIKRK